MTKATYRRKHLFGLMVLESWICDGGTKPLEAESGGLTLRHKQEAEKTN